MKTQGPKFRPQPIARLDGGSGEIDVWLTRIPPVDAGDPLVRGRDLLCAAELEACAAFARAEDRTRALATRVLVREVLSRYEDVDPREWEFALGPHGKPEVAWRSGRALHFNLSHSASLVACAVSREHELGVDLEDLERELDPLELAPRVCSPAEQAALAGLEPRARQRRFLEAWTLKEAYLKGRGLGFALEPNEASFELGRSGQIQARFTAAVADAPAAWWFALLEPLPGRLLALAARTEGVPARVRTFLETPGTASFEELAPNLRATSASAAA